MPLKTLMKMGLLFTLMLSSECSYFERKTTTLSGLEIWQSPNEPGKGYLRLYQKEGNPVSVQLQVLFKEDKMPMTVSVPLLNTGDFAQLFEFSFPQENTLDSVVIADIQTLDQKDALDDLEITNYPIAGTEGLEYTATNKGNSNIWFVGQTLDLGNKEDGTPFIYFGESNPVLVHPGETVTVQAISGNPDNTGALLIGCYAKYA